jgi:Flp pilus assembly pilin Flp
VNDPDGHLSRPQNRNGDLPMTNRFKNLLAELHEDESGPNTVEWVLLIIIALILVVAIFIFANFVIDTFKNRQEQVTNDPFINK